MESAEMTRYFRVQGKGISFDSMKHFVSADGGDGNEDQGGICAVMSAYDVIGNTAWDAANDDDEVVCFEGREICEIYDGYRVQPVSEVARWSCAEFKSNLDEICGFERY
jgi:hypothetical protein